MTVLDAYREVLAMWCRLAGFLFPRLHLKVLESLNDPKATEADYAELLHLIDRAGGMPVHQDTEITTSPRPLYADSSRERPQEVNQQRLTVEIPSMTLILDGISYDVASVNALRWVKVLAAHPDEWISGPELSQHDEELIADRPDRLKKYLPSPVLALIDTHRRKGSRLRLR